MMINSEKILSKLNNFVNREYDKAAKVIIFQNDDGSYELFDIFIITREENTYVVQKKTSYLSKTFFSLKNAVSWCIFEYKNKLNEANRVESLDRILNSILAEIDTHKYLVERTSDLDKKMIYLSKLSDNQVRKRSVFKELNYLTNSSYYLQLKQFAKNNQN